LGDLKFRAATHERIREIPGERKGKPHLFIIEMGAKRHPSRPLAAGEKIAKKASKSKRGPKRSQRK